MNKKKKIILITVIAIIIILLIIGTIFVFAKKNGFDDKEQKLSKLYDLLNSKTQYSFSTTLDDNNKVYYAKQNNVAYINELYSGTESKFIIKEGNTFLIEDSDKTYYTYQNNEIDLNKIVDSIEEIKSMSYEAGKEKIEDKDYTYEKYNVITNFLINKEGDLVPEKLETIFYFDGDELKYIKSILGTYQELLKVEISDDVDSDLFNIPSDYQEK